MFQAVLGLRALPAKGRAPWSRGNSHNGSVRGHPDKRVGRLGRTVAYVAALLLARATRARPNEEPYWSVSDRAAPPVGPMRSRTLGRWIARANALSKEVRRMSSGEFVNEAGRQDIDRAIQDAEAVSRFRFSVYIGPYRVTLRVRQRAALGAVRARRDVLIMVHPSARSVEVVTGQHARRSLTDNEAGLLARDAVGLCNSRSGQRHYPWPSPAGRTGPAPSFAVRPDVVAPGRPRPYRTSAPATRSRRRTQPVSSAACSTRSSTEEPNARGNNPSLAAATASRRRSSSSR